MAILKRCYFLILLACTFLLSSCAGLFAPFPGYYTRNQIAKINRNKLLSISEGMTKEEVILKMGSESLCRDSEGNCIYNPLGSEVIKLKNGERIEVVYYFTWNAGFDYWDWQRPNKLTDEEKEECTPLVFKNNKLIGWGKTFLEEVLGVQE